uniref:Uncharacterized protein n=1 Tax=Ciona savignyi TaxID=51511 RepID=H2ZCW8_CIOSA
MTNKSQCRSVRVQTKKPTKKFRTQKRDQTVSTDRQQTRLYQYTDVIRTWRYTLAPTAIQDVASICLNSITVTRFGDRRLCIIASIIRDDNKSISKIRQKSTIGGDNNFHNTIPQKFYYIQLKLTYYPDCQP